jgi:saxitoxin biosynthesis operon SxtJ-like protein
MISINWHPTDRELRQFAGIWFPAFWLIVSLLIGARSGHWLLPTVLTGIAAVIGLIGFIRPRLMRPVYVAWMCAVFPIGWLVSHLLLAAVFYLLITPLGLLLRLIGRDKLKLRFERDAKTYWTPREPPPASDRYFRQF